jgi:ATP-dependent DNA helicase RecQ
VALLAHFGDRRAATAPTGRCCDICDMLDWLPDPDTIEVRGSTRAKAPKAPAPEMAAADAPLFEALKAWRLGAAEGKPAFTVAANKTLTAIAAARPSDEDSLLAISGVGPAFISKYAPEVLAIVAEHAQPLAA